MNFTLAITATFSSNIEFNANTIITIMADTDDLIQRVQDLPPELFNHIRDSTFTVEVNKSIQIDTFFTPPGYLQVNRHARRVLALAYYRDNVFQFANGFTERNSTILVKWLTSLPFEHLIHVETVNFFMVLSGVMPSPWHPQRPQSLAILEKLLNDAHLDQAAGLLQVFVNGTEYRLQRKWGYPRGRLLFEDVVEMLF